MEKNNFFYKRSWGQKVSDWILGLQMPDEYYKESEVGEIRERVKEYEI